MTVISNSESQPILTPKNFQKIILQNYIQITKGIKRIIIS